MEMENLLDDIDISLVKKVSTLPTSLEPIVEQKLSVNVVANRDFFEISNDIDQELAQLSHVDDLPRSGTIFDGCFVLARDLSFELAPNAPDYLWTIKVLHVKSNVDMIFEISQSTS